MEINLEINRVFAGFGGLFGAAGIAAYAAAAHSPDGHMATIAPILFIHAPAFLALSILAKISRAAHFGGLVLVLGLLFFIGDLASRDYAGDRLFAFRRTAWRITAHSRMDRRGCDSVSSAGFQETGMIGVTSRRSLRRHQAIC